MVVVCRSYLRLLTGRAHRFGISNEGWPSIDTRVLSKISRSILAQEGGCDWLWSCPKILEKDLSEEPDITTGYSTCDRYKARRKFVAVLRFERLANWKNILVAFGATRMTIYQWSRYE